MVLKCIVRDCKSEWYPACNVILHSIPSDPILKQRWLTSVPLKKLHHKTAKICSLHFKETDYEISGKKLLRGAIPFHPREDPVVDETTKLESETMEQQGLRPKKSILLNILEGTHKNDNMYENMVGLKNPMGLLNTSVQKCVLPKKSLLLEMLETTHKDDDLDEKHMVKKSHELVYDTFQQNAPQKNAMLVEIAESTDTDDDMDRDMDEAPIDKKIKFESILPLHTREKSTQVRVITSKEKALEKKNKFLTQEVVRLKKSLSNLEAVIKNIKSSCASNSEFLTILNKSLGEIGKECK